MALRAAIWNVREDYIKAVGDSTEAIELEPTLQQAYFERGTALKQLINQSAWVEHQWRETAMNDFSHITLDNGNYTQANLLREELASADCVRAIRFNNFLTGTVRCLMVLAVLVVFILFTFLGCGMLRAEEISSVDDAPIEIPGENRTWTSSDGQREIEAKLIEISEDGQTITLQRTDGKTSKGALNKFSKEDQEYVQRYGVHTFNYLSKEGNVRYLQDGGPVNGVTKRKQRSEEELLALLQSTGSSALSTMSRKEIQIVEEAQDRIHAENMQRRDRDTEYLKYANWNAGIELQKVDQRMMESTDAAIQRKEADVAKRNTEIDKVRKDIKDGEQKTNLAYAVGGIVSKWFVYAGKGIVTLCQLALGLVSWVF